MTNEARVLPPEQTREVAPEDDSFFHHERSNSPWWNESVWFGFAVPEREINGFFWLWHRPNQKLTAGGVALWDPYGEERHNCLHYDWYNFNQLKDGSDAFDFDLENGMSCRLLEPLKRYELKYRTKTCEMDLLWEGIHPPLDLHFPRADNMSQFGGFHYEQIGRVTGSILVEGETLEVDCHHIRDRSWGVRARHRDHPGGGLDLGVVNEQTGFCTTMVRSDPYRDLDLPTVETTGYGQVVKDGNVARLVSAERKVLERRPDGSPVRLQLDLHDDLGRDMYAEGRVLSNLKWDDIYYVHWGLVDWTIDGRQAWGESQDWINQDLLRAHQRRNRKRGLPHPAFG